MHGSRPLPGAANARAPPCSRQCTRLRQQSLAFAFGLCFVVPPPSTGGIEVSTSQRHLLSLCAVSSATKVLLPCMQWLRVQGKLPPPGDTTANPPATAASQRGRGSGRSRRHAVSTRAHPACLVPRLGCHPVNRTERLTERGGGGAGGEGRCQGVPGGDRALRANRSHLRPRRAARPTPCPSRGGFTFRQQQGSCRRRNPTSR